MKLSFIKKEMKQVTVPFEDNYTVFQLITRSLLLVTVQAEKNSKT